jgi:hypothetical protein
MPAGAIAMCTHTHPVRHYTGISKHVAYPPHEVGDKFRALIQYDPDADTFLFAEFEYTDGDLGTLRVGSGNASGAASYFHTETGVGHNGLDQDMTLEACRSLQALYAQVESSSIAWDVVAPPSPVRRNWKAGIMNASSSNTTTIDQFSYEEQTATNNGCFPCECECDDFAVVKTLTVTLFATGICECLDGLTAEINWDSGQFPDWAWTGETTDWEDWLCLGGSGDMSFILQCSPDGEDWTLENPQWSGCGGFDVAVKPVIVQCSPFFMQFQVQDCDESGGGTCSMYFVITE